MLTNLIAALTSPALAEVKETIAAETSAQQARACRTWKELEALVASLDQDQRERFGILIRLGKRF